MPSSRDRKTLIIIVLGIAVAVLLIVVAFLLGKNSADRDRVTVPTEATLGAPTTPAAADPTTAKAADPTAEKAKDRSTSAPAASTPTTKPAEQPHTAAPRRLDISMTAGSLTFTQGAAFDIRYDDRVIDVKYEGDTAIVENAVRHPTASERRRMDVTVTLPEGLVLEDVDIEFGAGKLVVDTLRTNTLSLELGAGSASLNDLYVTEAADIQEGAGELSVRRGAIANLTLQCGAGATYVDTALTGASRIDAAFGAVDLNFEGSETDYTVSFQVGLGACYYNREKIARSGSFGEGPNRIDINGGMGMMRVTVG